jgi:hypothetical protein
LPPGTVYDQAVIACVLVLAAGAACPRCGDRWRWKHDDDADARRRSATRSAFTGRHRIPYTQSVAEPEIRWAA